MKKSYISIALSALFLLGACSKTDIEAVKTNPAPKESSLLTGEQKLLQETALLIGKTLSNIEARKEIMQKLEQVDKSQKAASISFLLGSNTAIMKSEVAFIGKQKNENVVEKAFSAQINTNAAVYPRLKEMVASNSSKGTVMSTLPSGISGNNISVPQAVIRLLENKNLQLFFPYGEYEENTDKPVSEYYVTYSPLTDAKTNEAFKFAVGSDKLLEVKEIDNDFIDENPVFVILPIDPEDMASSKIEGNVIELKPESTSFQSSLLSAAPPTAIANASPLPPPLAYKPTLLTYNVNHQDVPEEDILTVRMPKIRIRGTEWMGFGGRFQRIAIYRAAPETGAGKISFDNNGNPRISLASYQVLNYKTRRRNVRREHWLAVNEEFAPDWKMSHHTIDMIVFSKHYLKATIEVSAKVKAGIKLDSVKKIKVTPEAAVEIGGKVTSGGGGKFRGNKELSRREVLATIVGTGTTGVTYNDGGVNYNVKKIGILDFYFTYFYQKLKK